MPARHQRKIFTLPLSPATLNAIYTQHSAKPACQEDINAKFSHLLLAQLPRTQFTPSTPPNPHARKASTKNFHSSYWRSYPKRNLHTARRQTRMPARHQHKIFAAPIGTATPNTIYTQHAAKPACQERINAKFSHLLLAQLPQTQFTHSTPPNPNASRTSTQTFRNSYWRSYPEQNLHTASLKNNSGQRTIYTQHAAKAACQQNINANFSQLLVAQLPRTQFTHSTPPNPHARNTSTQNFRSSHWRSYPKRNLHTARRRTRMPAEHQRKIFAAPIGAATTSTIYTQHAFKPECQDRINAKFSQLPLAQLPQTQFTHSTPPNRNASRTSTQNFRTSYWPRHPEHNLHTTRRQTRMPGRHQRKIFAAPIGTATPNAIYTQHAAEPACQQNINAKFSQLLLAQLPRTQFTHSTPSNPHARITSTQNFRSSHWRSYPKRNLHTARRQTGMPAEHQRKIFAPPIGPDTPNTIYTQHAAKPECQEDINAKFSQLLLAQLPQTQFTHSTPPNPHARNTSTQNFRSSYWRSYPKRNLHTHHAATPARQQDINAMRWWKRKFEERRESAATAHRLRCVGNLRPTNLGPLQPKGGRNKDGATRQIPMPGRHQHNAVCKLVSGRLRQ